MLKLNFSTYIILISKCVYHSEHSGYNNNDSCSESPLMRYCRQRGSVPSLPTCLLYSARNEGYVHLNCNANTC